MSRLRAKFVQVGLSEAIKTTNSGYRLKAKTDIEYGKELLNRATATKSDDVRGALDLMTEALALWRGPFCEGITEDDLFLSPDLKEAAATLISDIILLKAALAGQVNGATAERLALHDGLSIAADPYIYLRLVQLCLESDGPNSARPMFEEACDTLGYRVNEMPDDFNDLAQRIEREAAQFDNSRGQARPNSPHTYSNVPAPMYATYVPRKVEKRQLNQALDQEKPIIAVTAIGGRGKTSLVNHFVRHLPQKSSPRFYAIVWVSDENDPGSTTFAALVDELAKTVNDSSLSQADAYQKEGVVRDFLQDKSVLFVIDNFETITDQALKTFLTRLPNGCKAIVTTIENDASISRFATPVEVHRPENDARGKYLQSILKSAGNSDISADDPQLLRIWEIADGNLRMVEFCIGLLRRRDLQSVEAMLTQAQPGDSDLTEIVLHTSFGDLTPAESTFLRAAACYPEGTTWHRLHGITGLSEDEYTKAEVEMLRKLLIRPVQGSALRIEPLVARRFGPTTDSPDTEAQGVRQRWLADIVRLAQGVGFCPDDLPRLQILDDSRELRNLEFALRWMRSHEVWSELRDAAKGVYYYYYVRGRWSSDPDPYSLWTLAASQLQDRLSTFESLVIRANIAAKQQNHATSADLFTKLQPLIELLRDDIPRPLMCKYRQALALHALSSTDYDSARDLWELNLDQQSGIELADYNASLRWYALCKVWAGDADAREWLEKSRSHSAKNGFSRALIRASLELARFDLHDPDSTVTAHDTLQTLDGLESEIMALKDPIYRAEYLSTRADALRELDRPVEAEELQDEARAARGQVPTIMMTREDG